MTKLENLTVLGRKCIYAYIVRHLRTLVGFLEGA